MKFSLALLSVDDFENMHRFVNVIVMKTDKK